MREEIAMRLQALRSEMLKAGIDADIIPQTDPHQSEYLASHWQVRRFLSGFTGSAGTLVVTADNALLWTDSRYFIQAAQQLADSGIVLMKDGLPTTPSIEDWLAANLPSGSTVGIDGMLLSATQAKAMESKLAAAGLKLHTDFDAIDNVWTDRPSLPKGLVEVHHVKYAGKDAKSKLSDILDNARQQGAEAAFIAPLDEIAWALNIRSTDVKFNPVATSYLYVGPKESILFIDPDKISSDIASYLHQEGISTRPYDAVKSFLHSTPDEKVLIEAGRTSVTLASILGNKAVNGSSAIALPKSIKNDVQIAGIRQAMVQDGIALTRAFMDFESRIEKGETVTELDVVSLLRKYRAEQPLFKDESFGSIVGFGPHGAIVHYEPDIDSNATISKGSLLLIDSGAQYECGTTDITRTIAIGSPSHREKHDFTLVMKGHIALAQAIYPSGTRGAQLDALARLPLWKEGKSYLHGTGHGVGHFLNVHEGPQSIRLNDVPTTLQVGMLTSNEPGLYIEGHYGIRCENLVLTVPAMTTEYGEFLKFETVTLFPFDRSLFETDIMTQEEIDWVDEYHRLVYDKISPSLNAAEKKWLKGKTAPLNSDQDF